ncbi:hypothetical protein HPB50_012221 [Hyalomma asiaticum]|uniref:Uncharacterized protein n=1 Tax=Hyalomma asiaticum TaxID=266040 RepID=A0ACB7SVN2_HYAAI|nr:hypothetical protein HPB50_012221 [Hyalomma asiaticum]
MNDEGPGIQLTTSDGQLVPIVDKIRILGLHITANGHNGETIRRLEGAVAQAIRRAQTLAAEAVELTRLAEQAAETDSDDEAGSVRASGGMAIDQISGTDL